MKVQLEWHLELLNADVSKFKELKEAYANASLVTDERVRSDQGAHGTVQKEMNIELRIIRTEAQYEEYLEWPDRQFDRKVKPDSPLGEKVQVALLLIK
jgi:hypothetical protein